MKHFYLLLAAVFFSLNIHSQNAPFITTWQVLGTNLSITIPTTGTGYDYTVDFGDGTVQNNVAGNVTHTYSAPGVYTVSITGDFPSINFGSTGFQNSNRIISVEQWGDNVWTSMAGAFQGCTNLNINATDVPDLSQVSNMASMFHYCSSLNQPLNNWNVSNVTNMSGMFYGASSFNQPLNSWDVSNVTDMSNMFAFANSFNQSLNNWNVSNVTDMTSMFQNASDFNGAIDNWDVSNVNTIFRMFQSASSFNQPLNNWNVSNVTNMWAMFRSAISFNQSLNNWNVSNVTIMENMFYGATSFNQPLNNWDTSNVIYMKELFTYAASFNQSINDWNVSNVIDMTEMFRNAISFNQSINDWNVSNVTNMKRMFYNANSFNQPLDNWNVSNVTDMIEMFRNATFFNQPINNWDVSNVTTMAGMFFQASSFNQNISYWNFHNNVNFSYSGVGFLSSCGMDTGNYDALLLRFAQLGLTNKSMEANGLKYCATEVRDFLINQRGWTINWDSLNADCNMITGTVLFDQNNNGCDPNDIGVHGFMINANDGTNDWITFSSNGNYNLSVYGTNFTVSVVNQPSYFTVTPASVPVTFTTSSTEIVDFCVTSTQTIEDLNITLLPVSEARPGFEADYRLVVRNVGTETVANVLVTLDFDDMMQQFVSANPTPGTTTANSLTFPIGSMQPFQTFEADITMQTFPPPTVNGDDIVNFTAEVTPGGNDFTPNDNIYDLAQVVVNSYDPNDKQVLQGEELHIDHVDEYLDYLIRFQNTGTASAINVRILDTLHPKLDWNTLTPISASHDYYVQITDGNQVEFMFDDIHLPDETTNEPESHGFVAYKIKPKNNVQVGDVISGDAAIYFDFNAPIITNMVHTEIVEPMGLTDNSNPLNQVILHPNPTNKTLHIYLTEGIQLEEVIIYDLQGQEVQKVQGNKTAVEVGNLSPGMYFLKITTNRGVVNRKLVKN